MNNLSRERNRKARMRDMKAKNFRLIDFLPEKVIRSLEKLGKEKR